MHGREGERERGGEGERGRGGEIWRVDLKTAVRSLVIPNSRVENLTDRNRVKRAIAEAFCSIFRFQSAIAEAFCSKV
jgi:RNase P protein component